MNSISIRKMRVFLAAVEEGSFTRASIRENISQPAATIIINQIEETVGCELFERQGNTRRAKLTEMGNSTAETFTRIVASYDIELAHIGELASGRRGVRSLLIQFALADCLESQWMAALLDLFSHEKVKIECLSRGEIMDRLNNREATLAVVDGEADEDRYDKFAVTSYRYVRAGLAEGCVEDQKSKSAFVLAGFHEKALKRVRDLAAPSNNRATDWTGGVMEVGSLPLAARLMERGRQDAFLPDFAVSRLEDYLGVQLTVTPAMVPDTDVVLLAPRGGLARFRLSTLRGFPPFRKLKIDAA